MNPGTIVIYRVIVTPHLIWGHLKAPVPRANDAARFAPVPRDQASTAWLQMEALPQRVQMEALPQRVQIKEALPHPHWPRAHTLRLGACLTRVPCQL